MNFWSCPRLWPGETAYVIAGGPSLTGFDFSVLQGRNVIAINSSAMSVPFAPFMFFGDDRWGYEHKEAVRTFAGEVVTVSSGCGVAKVRVMKKIVPPPGIMQRPDALVMRWTSLTAALNLAYHLGAGRIVLLGADMRAAPDGRTHHHKPHRWPQVIGCWNTQMLDVKQSAEDLALLGVEVVNTSLESLITWWPKRPIGEML